jgi:ATP-dependent DNA ligase
MNIHETLNAFASTSGLALSALVQSQLQHSPELQRYVTAVLDPSITYGQKGKIAWGGGQRKWDEGCYTLLDSLAQRRLTGSAAKLELLNFGQHYSVCAVDLMNRALDKELKCGVGIKLINSLGLDFHIPVFTCALAKPFEAKRIKPGSKWLGSIKFDGMRALAVVRDNSAAFFTRSGNEIPALKHLEPQVLEVFGGHHVVVDAEGVGVDFLDSVSTLRKTVNIGELKSSTILQCFDIIPFKHFDDTRGGDTVGGPLIERLMDLRSYFQDDYPNVSLLSHIDYGDDAALMTAAADRWMAAGFEGGVFKNAASRYSKKRSADWLKIKGEDPDTLEINAVYGGEAGGQFEHSLGGVVVTKNGVPSNVGGGWGTEERALIWAAHTGEPVKWSSIEQDKPTGLRVVTEHVAMPDPQHYVIGRLIDVLSNGTMPSGALRHARKIKFRDLVTAPGEIA